VSVTWRADSALLFILAALADGVTARNFRLSSRHKAIWWQPRKTIDGCLGMPLHHK
jgi:hypothetical protein